MPLRIISGVVKTVSMHSRGTTAFVSPLKNPTNEYIDETHSGTPGPVDDAAVARICAERQVHRQNSFAWRMANAMGSVELRRISSRQTARKMTTYTPTTSPTNGANDVTNLTRLFDGHGLHERSIPKKKPGDAQSSHRSAV